MNEEPTKSYAAVTNWLAEGEWIIYVVTGVILLFYQVPAYKRFRTRALLLLVVSGALSVFVTAFDQTFSQYSPAGPNDLWRYYLLREITWFTSLVLGTVGALMFLRDYVILASAAPSNSSFALSSPSTTTTANDKNPNV